ncbi:FtsX-like permease family protein [Halopseudomonas salegens]|uniref:Putative ABC transport system permease protein n=1 Tax=Halopseudomonas salegens TaxID=1434072 RepID=A0A1H2E766_9GAMM|nr:FtsX-like permease family protein [Halopseudomonas salegens]SDT91022.1 putative ABC transport system permease protein [Halopseudomonas salegens]
MMRWVLQALLSHWRRHPVQAICLLVGIWLASALWTGVQALNTQARSSYDRAAQLFTEGSQPMLVSPGGQLFSEQDFVRLRRAGWPVSPVLQGSVLLPLGDGERRYQVMGIDPISLPSEGSLAGQVSSTDSLLDFVLAPGRTLLASDTLQELGLEQGAVVTVVDGDSLPPLQAAPGLPPGVLIMDMAYAQQLLQQPGKISQLLVPADFAAMAPALPEGITLSWEERSEDDLVRLTNSFHLNLTALGLLAFVVGLFIVHAAAGLALEQRRGMLQSLRACGVSLRLLAVALISELLLLALLGGSLGIITGYLLANALVGDLVASLRGLYGAQVAGVLALQPSWWLAGLGMSVLGTLLAGASSLWLALRLPVLAWARPQAWHEAQAKSLRRLGALAIVLLLVAGALLIWGDGLLSGLLLLACLLLGAAWLLPWCLHALLRLGQRSARGPVSQWFWGDAQQQMGGLSLALMALLLALSANIGVGSMTEGFRMTFIGWLDQRLAADVYVRPENPQQAEEIAAWLDQRDEVRAQLPSWQLPLRVGGWPSEISGIIEHPLYADTWPLLDTEPRVWERLASGEGALISEQLAYRLELQPGDSLELNTPAGPWQLRVLGRYADYGNPRGQVLVAAEGLQQRWPDQPLSSVGVLISPNSDDSQRAEQVATLVADLQQAFGLASNRVIDQAALKRYSRQVFEQTFAATGALNILTLGVAAIALLTSLLTLADSRLTQLAPLWAMGLRPGQLARLSMWQMLLLATLTCLLATPLGLALAWCLVNVVNVQAFGWRLPWHWFPLQWLQLIALALLAVVLASLGPLWRLARSGPQTLLRRFTQDA